MSTTSKPLTGRKVLLIMLGMFSVIIGANVMLAVTAIGTFPGLEVENTYVTSQTFDAERVAQARLGWKLETHYDGKAVTLAIRDSNGQSPKLQKLDATIGRATYASADVTLNFAPEAPTFRREISLAPGKWELRVHAVAADGTAFRQRLPIWVN